MTSYRVLLTGLLLAFLTACDSEEESKPAPPAPPPDRGVDHVFLNGYVYTADGSGTIAQAIAVRGDRIAFVGSNADALAFVGDKTWIHGLDGKMVLPGLHDVHIHLFGLVEPNACDLKSEPVSLEQMPALLKDCLKRHPLTDGWLMVDQWNFIAGNQPGGSYATIRAALDDVSRQIPIFLRGNDGHHAAVNSAALARAPGSNGRRLGLNGKTLRSEFAAYRDYIGIDAAGEPDGMLSETARILVDPPDIWGFSSIDPVHMPEIGRVLARSGLTSVQDAALSPEALPMFDQFAQHGGMHFRLTAALYPDFGQYRNRRTGRVDIDAVLDDLRRVREHFSAHPTIKATAAKIYIDGVIEGNPFANPPTLPNGAVLRPYRQPLFRIDPERQIPILGGYVDLNSESCTAVRRDLDKYREPKAAGQFQEANGFHPRQCVISYGLLNHDEAFIRNYMRALHENDFVIHAHAIGDRAVRIAVTHFAILRDEFGPHKLPHAIAHAQLVHPRDQALIGALGIHVAFTYAWMAPDFLYDMSLNPFISRIDGNDGLYDPDTYVWKSLYPVRGILRTGGVLTAGSDAPVDTRDPRPFVNMAQAVTRANARGEVLNEHETVDIHEVIAAYTRNGARALQQDSITGTIEAGKKADLIVLSQNLVELADQGKAAQIAETEVLTTLFDGKIIYQAN